jgi:FkbM family methyltransferase
VTKNKLRSLFGYLGIKVPGLVKLILMLMYSFPRLFIAVAQWSGLSQAVMARTWNIHRGPLKGYRLFNLLPSEIVPVLANSMEIRCSDLLSKLNIKSAIVFDVGGSYGYYALLLARLVEVGKVYSFEPDWRSYGRLVQNLAINAIQNVVPVPVCISNSQPTLMKWSSRQEDPWNSGLANDQQTGSQNLTTVPVMSLDGFSQTLNIQNQLRLIKIDVEGAELDVLKGATHLLDSAQPLMLCELHSAEIAQQVFKFLSTKGYEWEMIEYMNETRQHILAFPASQSAQCRAVITK